MATDASSTTGSGVTDQVIPHVVGTTWLVTNQSDVTRY